MLVAQQDRAIDVSATDSVALQGSLHHSRLLRSIR